MHGKKGPRLIQTTARTTPRSLHLLAGCQGDFVRKLLEAWVAGYDTIASSRLLQQPQAVQATDSVQQQYAPELQQCKQATLSKHFKIHTCCLHGLIKTSLRLTIRWAFLIHSRFVLPWQFRAFLALVPRLINVQDEQTGASIVRDSGPPHITMKRASLG